MTTHENSDLYKISAKRLDGQLQSLNDYRGQVLLIVNVASKCGFTGHYADLQSLYEEFKDQGFSILGFPCNQFGFQEPGDEQQIASFCSTTYNATFPMFAKINVNGNDAHPLYNLLKTSQRGLLGSAAIKWNFTKFLVGRDGSVVARYAPTTSPSQLREDIANELAKKDG